MADEDGAEALLADRRHAPASPHRNTATCPAGFSPSEEAAAASRSMALSSVMPPSVTPATDSPLVTGATDRPGPMRNSPPKGPPP